MSDNKNVLEKCSLIFENQDKEISISDFRIIHQLGQGGFGQVLKVESLITGF